MKPRILFVDDEPRVLAALQRMLCDRQDEWEMFFADDARKAFDRACTSGVDVIISDIQMPGMNGFQLLQKLRDDRATRHIPVIILTGSDDHQAKQRALELDAIDLLNKPADPHDVIARVRNALRLKYYQDELKAQNVQLEQMVEERTRELAASRLDIIWRLANAGEHRDEITGNHVVRVGCYCRALARAMDLDTRFVDMLFLASPLHDIGKIGIPDHILLKPGPLDHEEWEIMKRHCEIGAGILRQRPRVMEAWMTRYGAGPRPEPIECENPILAVASSIALSHHERWDGTGYPLGLAGQDIPLEARVVAVADVYDALCSQRPYKPPMPQEEVWRIMRAERGSHFDPDVYRAAEQCTDELNAIRHEFRDESVLCGTFESRL